MRTTLVALVMVVAGTALADAKHPNPFLSQAKVFFTNGDGEKCLKRLIQSEKWKFNDRKDRAEIELYGGMCGYLMGETQAAEVSFKRAVEYNPKIALPAEASPGIAVLWSQATGKQVKPEVAAAAAAEQKAKEAAKAKPVVDKRTTPPIPPKSDAPQVAAVAETPVPVLTPVTPASTVVDVEFDAAAKRPRSFAVPVLLGAGAIAGGAIGGYLGVSAKAKATQYGDPNVFQSDADKLKSQAQGEALGANIAFGVAGALAIGALAVLIFGS